MMRCGLVPGGDYEMQSFSIHVEWRHAKVVLYCMHDLAYDLGVPLHWRI